MTVRPLALAAALLALAPGAALAVEGKWTPQQVLELDPAWLRQQGLKLPPSRLWDPRRGTGLLAGAVNVGGCSGSFISETGLVITNHHCVFGVVQEHSSPQRDLITQGFLARTQAEELPGTGSRVAVPRAFTDVTKEIEAAVPAGADDLARNKAIEKKQKELVRACEQKPAAKCQVSSFDGGTQYVLAESVELQDVRLVYAPPRGVGEFGGEEDNWMWPRHTGDFAIIRAYVAKDGSSAPYAKDNVPHRPEFFFPLNPQGVKPGDFVMVLGYPGTTFRAWLAEEMAFREARFYPRLVDVYGELIGIMEEESKKDDGARITLASTLKSLHNRWKNAKGQLQGLKRGGIVKKAQAQEEAVVAWAQKRPEHAGAVKARAELQQALAAERGQFEREFLLGTVSAGARAPALAVTLARAADERRKPDLERRAAYMDREQTKLRERVEREQKNLHVPTDKRLLAAFVRRAQALGAGERIAAVDRHFGAAWDPARVTAKIDALYAGTKVTSLEERLKMLGETQAQLRARKDPLLDLGLDLAGELAALDDAQDRRAGLGQRLRPQWRRAVLAHAGKPVAPDANSTLRVAFAHVKGYAPRDGYVAVPQTTGAGQLAKHTGEEPFDLPEKFRTKLEARTYGPWVDKGLKDLPVNFLADADTTGGNSGSPTVDGSGRLVGVNFDRVWENVANDFGYNPEVARNVNVDVRYVLWTLDQVENADELLRELKVRKGGAPKVQGAGMR